jgi:DnaJ family protein C protein 9
VLKIHPDKNKEDPEAKDKFAKLTEAYQILTDPKRKAEYDETGTVGEQFNLSAFQSAYVYFRQIYKKIEEKDIEDFAKGYIGGDMEAEDLLKFYKDNKGDLTLLLQHIPLSHNSDIDRFVEFFEQRISKG